MYTAIRQIDRCTKLRVTFCPSVSSHYVNLGPHQTQTTPEYQTHFTASNDMILSDTETGLVGSLPLKLEPISIPLFSFVQSFWLTGFPTLSDAFKLHHTGSQPENSGSPQSGLVRLASRSFSQQMVSTQGEPNPLQQWTPANYPERGLRQLNSEVVTESHVSSNSVVQLHFLMPILDLTPHPMNDSSSSTASPAPETGHPC
ncbi:hypothetical protein CSKR_111376 [Clonorchis sinensis]|uniref:Uncharacterized protein n=1 Tax=Clonorchis sinensis TaxID=79923 RepID=A0A3R7CUQ8_CLOSI|nr:hypothetical protein CSKR_111376 [Clonorchis sinensis]